MFEMEVISVVPATNESGERLICVTLGLEGTQLTQMIPNKEEKENLKTAKIELRGLPSPPPLLRTPILNRMILFFSILEWESFEKNRFVVGDKYHFSQTKKGFLIEKIKDR